MKTIYITINENDMADVDGNMPNVAAYQRMVEKNLGSEYDIKWTVNRNTSGYAPDPECIDDDGNGIDIEPIITRAMEQAIQSNEIWK